MTTEAYGCTCICDGKNLMILTEYEPDVARMEGKVCAAMRLELIAQEKRDAANGSVR